MKYLKLNKFEILSCFYFLTLENQMFFFCVLIEGVSSFDWFLDLCPSRSTQKVDDDDIEDKEIILMSCRLKQKIAKEMKSLNLVTKQFLEESFVCRSSKTFTPDKEDQGLGGIFHILSSPIAFLQ